MDVAALVQQMQDTLSEINATVAGLSTEEEDARLDELDEKRERLLHELQESFEREQEELEKKRRAEEDEIAEKRRKEDEEREARRKREDEELRARMSSEDGQRHGKFEQNTNQIEDETDQQMDEVEQAAQKKVEDGTKKLHELEERRREINRRIDEQLTKPLPPTPNRKRTRTRGQRSLDMSSNKPSFNNDRSSMTSGQKDGHKALSAQETLANELPQLPSSEIGSLEKHADQSQSPPEKPQDVSRDEKPVSAATDNTQKATESPEALANELPKLPPSEIGPSGNQGPIKESTAHASTEDKPMSAETLGSKLSEAFLNNVDQSISKPEEKENGEPQGAGLEQEAAQAQPSNHIQTGEGTLNLADELGSKLADAFVSRSPQPEGDATQDGENPSEDQSNIADKIGTELSNAFLSRPIEPKENTTNQENTQQPKEPHSEGNLAEEIGSKLSEAVCGRPCATWRQF
ncbi:hypothetical protein F5Y15DRAFT_99978 [Xylariaceae sp. FL0016]|nr:hypothetical protein F5Y15DRAFT_99978 [Xylariaceae sp. FL0016]